MKPHQTILVLEDDSLEALTLERAFTDAIVPNPWVIFATAQEGLSYLHRQDVERPGLVLLDLNLPGMSGLDFLRRMKADVHLRSIPVVILTSSSDEQERREAFELSAAGYFVKPIQYGPFVELIKVVKSYWLLAETAG
ncbi:MAG: response regulator [Chloroflexi bacterium]|nr:response regulator [Chloroflexota bacterium]